MDLTAEKIIVLDLEDLSTKQVDSLRSQQQLAVKHFDEVRNLDTNDGILCFNREIVTLSTCFILVFVCLTFFAFTWRFWRSNKL